MYGGMSLVANVSKSIVDREMKKERDNSTSEKSIFSLKRSKSKNGKKPEPTTQPDNSLLQQPPASAESSIRTSASSSNFNDQRSSSTSAMRSSASSANQRTMSNDSWTAPSAEYSATALSTNDYLAQMLGDLHVQHLEYIQEDNEENDLDDIVGLYGDEVDDKSNELGGSLSRKKTPYNSLISALNELITTERSYVQSLQTLYKTILLPLKEYGKKMISEKDYNLLASNLTEIIGVHETLLGGLEERFLTHPPPSIPPVTDLYLCTIPFLRTYVTYISNYSSALTLTSHLRATNEKFKALIESSEQSEDFKGLKFEAYLIMPVQRVPRYRLLLENVEKAIKTVVEDYVQSLSGEVDFGDVLHYSNGKLEVDLSRWTGKGGVIVKNVDGMDVTVDENEIIAIRDCVEKIRGVADGINESVRQHETRLRVLQIQASLSSIPNAFQLIQPNRQFIAEFRAYKVSRTGFEKRQLFLFNDILLISKPLGSSTSSHRKTRIFGSRSKDTEKFEYKNSIELIFTWIDANEEDDSRRESPYGIVGLGINSFTSDDGNPATPTSQASYGSYGSGPISPAFELDEKERETKKYPVRLLTTSAAGDQTLTFFIVGASHKDKFVKLVAESIENARGSSAYLGKALDSLNRNSSQSNGKLVASLFQS
ncbi:Dbl homology domain-containing protein [Paraphysoderma sedebokerense]|nr:Dbl homology domain-containing protein [Paraphysoderma sedebokerense]